MQRLIEQPADAGEVFQRTLRLGRAHYHLSVYQHFSDVADESVPANLEVEGRIVPIDDIDLASFHQEGAELTLRLADGRSVDFSIMGDEGRSRSTGRGLYQDARS
jgi:hypothetical protein